jgi:hypothetical protein
MSGRSCSREGGTPPFREARLGDGLRTQGGQTWQGCLACYICLLPKRRQDCGQPLPSTDSIHPPTHLCRLLQLPVRLPGLLVTLLVRLCIGAPAATPAAAMGPGLRRARPIPGALGLRPDRLAPLGVRLQDQGIRKAECG